MPPRNLNYPVTNTSEIIRACNATEPLQPGDRRWFDFEQTRHAQVLARLQKVFRGTVAGGDFHRRVLCGHRGCGKSTELLRFKQWADQDGFCAVRIEVDVEFGFVDLDFSDFYLMAIKAAEVALRDFNESLPPDAARPVVEWFADIERQDTEERKSELSVEASAQLGGGLFGIGKLVAKFAAARKAGSSHVVTVRERVRRSPNELIDKANGVLQTVQNRLIDLGRARGLVLMFDNLDRYDPVQISSVVMQESSLLKHLRCSTLYTIPIDLEYDPRHGPLRDTYGQPIVVPMISLRHQSNRWENSVATSPHDEVAVGAMLSALGKRVDVKSVFRNPDDARKLVLYSGGCIRDLMHLMTLCYEMSEDTVISPMAVDEAVREMRATYTRILAEEDYARLAQLADHKEPRDPQTLRLLFNRAALEYSGSNHDVWRNVHPLVVETDDFRRAYAANHPITTA